MEARVAPYLDYTDRLFRGDSLGIAVPPTIGNLETNARPEHCLGEIGHLTSMNETKETSDGALSSHLKATPSTKETTKENTWLRKQDGLTGHK